jgi:hypothetical protein|nr:MAG TPA: hypothetical protein [Caudoviricetes sp.]
MAEYNLGKVIPQFKGRYDKKETYEDLDVVAHNGCAWVSMVNNNKSEPSESNTKWRLLVDNSSNEALETNLGTFAYSLQIIGQRLEELTNKIEEVNQTAQENKKNAFESETLIRDSINSAAFVRTKLNEMGTRLQKIENKLGIK